MKFAKTSVLLLLAVAMILSMAACGGAASVASAASEADTAPAAEAASDAEEAAPVNEVPTDNEVELQEVTLPLTEEQVTFSFFYSQPDMFNAYLENPADSPVVQELMNRTNIALDYMVVSNDAEADRFKVLAASGSLTDLVLSGSTLYTGGGAKGVEDEVFVNLADYAEAMPNYFSYVNKDADWTALLSQDGGSVVDAVYVINYPPTSMASGIMIRQDWLDDLGLNMPQTYDEYYEVLTAFKTEKNASAPLLIHEEASNAVWAIGFGANCAISDHDFTTELFGEVNGEVVFWPITDNYRDYLETMNKWYAEGLIDQDWSTRSNGNSADSSLIGTNNAGVWWSPVDGIHTYNSLIDDPNANVVAAPIAGRDANYTDAMVPAARIRDRTCVNISTNCADPELAARFLDYLYSEEGQLLSNYGVEGYTFEYNENGEPVFTEFVTNSETGFGPSLTLVLYGLGNYPTVFNPSRFYDSEQLDAIAIWEKCINQDSIYHSISSAIELSAEDSEEVTPIFTDILTYVREMTFKIMCNQDSIDSFDTMVETVKAMGIDDVIAGYQNAYNAYYGIG